MVLVWLGSNDNRLKDMRESGVDGLPFWLQTSSSEANTCNTQIFWVRALRDQWLPVYYPCPFFGKAGGN